MELIARNVIDGELQPAADGTTLPLVDPVTGAEYGTAPQSGRIDVDRAMRAASDAFRSWSRTTPSGRQEALNALARTLEEHADELLAAEVQDTGKPAGLTASEEMPAVLDTVRFYAGAARVLEGRASAEYIEDHTSTIRREPVGVVAQVTPWNYPLLMAVWKIAPALAAGNTVVLKPSELTPVSTVLLAELAQGVLPPGVLNVVCGDHETGRLLVSHPVPALVAITGSVRAGRQVARAAADGLKRTHLELGGNAPVLVFDDADLDAAVEAIATAAYFNAGQDCTAASRVLVHEAVEAEFLRRLVDHVATIRTGPPDDEDVLYGPLVSRRHLDEVAGLVDRVPDHATVLAGGRRVDREGFFYEPTVISGLRQDDEIVQSEIFGPVLTTQVFATEAEAHELANGTPYGLASSVFTRDHGRATRAARELDFGCVWINTHIPLAAEMPHGGFGDSGHGKDLSLYGLEEYTRVKHVMSYVGAA